MIGSKMRVMAVAVCLVMAACPDQAASQAPAGDAKAIEGLWSGSWGGGQRDGVVFQPVIAELVITGDQVDLAGFRNVGRLTGTVRLDGDAKRMRLTPAAPAGGQAAPRVIEFVYALKDDMLTLTDSDKVSISLQKQRTAQNPLANARVELVTATGINAGGDLLVSEFTVLQAGRAGATYFRPENRSLSTRQATVLLVQETGLKKVTVNEARRLIREATPVVVTYRTDDRAAPQQVHELWKDVGSPLPDSEAVGQTFARLLRPGTLVFVLSASANAPRP